MSQEFDFDFHDVFQHSRVSLWIEDYTFIRQQLDAIRAQGVTDFPGYLDAHPEMIDACVFSIKVLHVNAYTLKMFGAPSIEALREHLPSVFGEEMRRGFRKELEHLWVGCVEMDTETINYALDGSALHLHLSRSILPGHEGDWSRILISLTDIGARKYAMDEAARNQRYARSLFEHSPIALCVQDMSAVRLWLGDLRASGVSDLPRYLAVHPHALKESLALIKLLEANQQALALYRAASKRELISNVERVLRDDMVLLWEAQLLNMWAGKFEIEYEGVNYALDGTPLDLVIRTSLLPGAEETWDRVLIAISDVTARKKADAHINWLVTHDVLTGLRNRSYFEEERQRLENKATYPVSIVMIDLNDLKLTNDASGHEAGDDLLRRAGEVIMAVASGLDTAARMGGDEFALLLPRQDEAAAQRKLARINALIDADNARGQGARLSLSLGAATALDGTALEQVQKQADARMYEDKRRHYLAHGRVDRRAR